jgi:hypothetical protein
MPTPFFKVYLKSHDYNKFTIDVLYNHYQRFNLQQFWGFWSKPPTLDYTHIQAKNDPK